jgi:hypothetical protein
MDQGNLAILVDAKFEYTKQLINILKNNIFQGIKKIYISAKEYSIEHDELEKVLKKFQFYLSEIPKWNQDVILKEVTEILEKSKCDWLEELITAVFVSHTRILTSINSNKNKKKINLNIPKIDHFIHQCYIDVARAFWKTPYLFDDSLNNYEYQRNRRDAEGIIEICIQETIRKQLPVKHILKEYLGKDYDTDTETAEVEDIESEDYSNLRKMVKAEIENCSKEQLIGSVSKENDTGNVAVDDSVSDSVAASENVSDTIEENLENSEQLDSSVSETPVAVPESESIQTNESESVPVQESTPVLENVSTENVQLNIQENEISGMKIESLDLDNIDSLDDLTKLDIPEVDTRNLEYEIIDLNNVEGLDDLDSELNQVDLSLSTSTVTPIESPIESLEPDSVLTQTPTLEKDVSNIKKIVIEPSEFTEEDRRKKEVLKKYGRKRNLQFFNDSLESDDEL